MDTLAKSNSVFVTAAPGVILGCMDSDARELMDRALEAYDALVRSGEGRRRVEEFVRWLFKESRLVDDVEEEALAAHAKHWAGVLESLRRHPNQSFRRRHSRRSIYGFAYWFFRWSGLVGPDGKRRAP